MTHHERNRNATRNSSRTARGTGPRGVEALEGRTLFATFVWDGGGANANWTTPANWVGDVAPPADRSATLEFPSAGARKANTNNFPAGTGFVRILFTGGGYALTGNPITLLDNVNAAENVGGNRFELDSAIGAGQSTTWGFIANGTSTINVHGSVDNAGNTLTFSGSGVTHVFEGVTGTGGLAKNGSGDVLLSGPSSYSGTTTVTEGNLYLNNADPAGTTGPVVVTGGVLRGSGRIGAVTIQNGGKFIPGPTALSTAVLNTGALTLAAGGTLYLNLNGTTAGDAYDQVNVTGAVSIDPAAALRLTPGGPIGVGDAFTVVGNDGADPVAGTFAGLPEGGRVSAGNVTFAISYVGGDGNDVVLTAVAANNPPINAVPNGLTTPQDVPLVLSAGTGSAIRVSDPDAGASAVQLSLSVTNGTLTVPSTAGLTFSNGDGTSDATMRFTGTLAAINAAIDGLTFTPAASYVGGAVLTVTSDDLGNTGPGGAQSDTDTVTITVLDPSAVPPVAADVAATREIGQNSTVDPLSVAADPLGRPLTLGIASNPVSGTVELDDAGTPADPSDDFITYTAAPGFNGDDAFTYRLTTAAGATATGAVTVTTNSGVAVDQDPDDPTKSALFIVGTDASEQFQIVRNKSLLRVLVNKVQQNDLYTFPTGSIVVIAKGGDDTFSAGPLKRAPQRLYGGDGNDTLVGGRFARRFVGGKFSDVLVGGAGDDTLKGGGSSDFVVGGAGTDRVNGGGASDILISGGGDITAYTAPNVTAIRELLNAWTAAADYGAAVTAVTVTGVGPAATKLGASTLTDDDGMDLVSGLAGNDVFFCNTAAGSLLDRLRDLKESETGIDLE